MLCFIYEFALIKIKLRRKFSVDWITSTSWQLDKGRMDGSTDRLYSNSVWMWLSVKWSRALWSLHNIYAFQKPLNFWFYDWIFFLPFQSKKFRYIFFFQHSTFNENVDIMNSKVLAILLSDGMIITHSAEFFPRNLTLNVINETLNKTIVILFIHSIIIFIQFFVMERDIALSWP